MLLVLLVIFGESEFVKRAAYDGLRLVAFGDDDGGKAFLA
jgi:hypothetical protein